MGRLTHGLRARSVTTAVVNLRGFNLDRRSKPFLLATEIMDALGGEAYLSPQKRRLVDLLTRANLLLDAADAWLFEQQSVISPDGHSLLPVIRERQAIADHVARLLDKLGLERVAKPINLTEYYAEATPLEAPPAEPEPVAPAEPPEAAPDGDADDAGNTDAGNTGDSDTDAGDEPVHEPAAKPVRTPVRSPIRHATQATA
jgi:hypothetical protein